MESNIFDRRRTIKLASAILVTPLAGCTIDPERGRPWSTADNTGTSNPETPPGEMSSMSTRVTTTAYYEYYLKLEPANPDGEQRKWIQSIEFDTLPSEEREIVKTALRNGPYTEDFPGSDPMQSLAERIKNHKIAQVQAYQDEHEGNKFPRYLDAAYLLREDQYYSIVLFAGDVAVSA